MTRRVVLEVEYDLPRMPMTAEEWEETLRDCGVVINPRVEVKEDGPCL